MMIHSFLIVGGTVKKRRLETERVAAPLCGARFDTTIIEPEEDKQTISIDQIRDLQHQLSLRPYAGEFKTGIILEAQRLTVEAQNALLKTLEEPPAHSVLVLTAPSTKNLLPTTVSRCQIVRLPAEIDLDLESEEHQQAVEEFLELLGAGGGERLAWIEENKKIFSQSASGGSTLNMLDVWISVLRDLLLANSDCQNLVLNSFNGSSKSFKHSNSKLDESISLLFERSEKSKVLEQSEMSLHSSILLTQKTKNLIASTNVSPRLALEVLLLDLPQFTLNGVNG